MAVCGMAEKKPAAASCGIVKPAGETVDVAETSRLPRS